MVCKYLQWNRIAGLWLSERSRYYKVSTVRRVYLHAVFLVFPMLKGIILVGAAFFSWRYLGRHIGDWAERGAMAPIPLLRRIVQCQTYLGYQTTVCRRLVFLFLVIIVSGSFDYRDNHHKRLNEEIIAAQRQSYSV